MQHTSKYPYPTVFAPGRVEGGGRGEKGGETTREKRKEDMSVLIKSHEVM